MRALVWLIAVCALIIIFYKIWPEVQEAVTQLKWATQDLR